MIVRCYGRNDFFSPKVHNETAKRTHKKMTLLMRNCDWTSLLFKPLDSRFVCTV